jgi:protein TonB
MPIRRMEKVMTSLARTSKKFGFAGTAMLHCGILMTCLVVVVPRAVPIPLPPPVETLRITLAEPVAASPPKPQAAPAPEPPVTVPVVEKAMPPEVVPPVAKPPVTPNPAPRNPRPVQAKPSPPQEASPQTVSAVPPLPQQPDQESLTRAQRAAEARQTLLSALVARLEREKRYPTAARRLGIEGQVMAMVQVDSQGRIISVSARSGEEQAILEKATLDALQRVQAKWSPVPVPEAMTLNIPIRYSLNNS